MSLTSCTNPPVTCGSTWSQPALWCQHPDGFCHTGNARQDTELSLAAEEVSAGLLAVKAEAAPRWPPASLDSSHALRFRQLREEQGENRPADKPPVFHQALRVPTSGIYSPVTRRMTQEEPWHSV